MRRIGLFFVLLLGLLGGVVKAGNPSQTHDRVLRDSVFRAIEAMPQDTLRYEKVCSLFQKYIGTDWGLELADFALQDAKALNSPKRIINALYISFCYEHDRMNHEKEGKILKQLKETCYKYKDYETYFSAWTLYLGLSASKGNYEDVLNKADEMRREATRLDYHHGMTYAWMVEASVYTFMNDNKKVIDASLKALECQGLTVKELLNIYGNLSDAYMRLGKNKGSLSYTDKMKSLLDSLVQDNPENKMSWANELLEVEHRYAKAYYKEGNFKEVQKHLLAGDTYYPACSYVGYKVVHHELWAFYYRAMKQWDGCIHEIDAALSLYRENGGSPISELVLYTTRTAFLYSAGRTDECLDGCELLVATTDSLNRALLQRQEETFRENSAIQQALLQKEKNATKRRLICAGASFLLFLFVAIVTVRGYFIHRSLKHARRLTAEATRTAQEADKVKDIFLKNITNRIDAPLKDVVRYSQLLSTDKTLSMGETADYSGKIKESSESLMVLINNILDLSRLESGMMKYVVAEHDIVKICRDAINEMADKTGKVSVVNFTTDTERWMFPIDSNRFHKMLVSIFSFSGKEKEEVHCDCLLQASDDAFSLIIKGSPLTLASVEGQERDIVNEINRLFVKAFHGTYSIEDKCISITFKR